MAMGYTGRWLKFEAVGDSAVGARLTGRESLDAVSPMGTCLAAAWRLRAKPSSLVELGPLKDWDPSKGENGVENGDGDENGDRDDNGAENGDGDEGDNGGGGGGGEGRS